MHILNLFSIDLGFLLSDKMSQTIIIPIPDDLRFVPKQFSEDWANGGFIERAAAVKVWRYVQETVMRNLALLHIQQGPWVLVRALLCTMLCIKRVLRFEKLFALNLLSFGGPIILKYSDLSGTQEQIMIQIRHFITLPADKPKNSWKDYPTSVAHCGDGEARLDFIFFGGTDCTWFFKETVAKDVSKKKFPQFRNDGRVELILASIGKWMGGMARISDQKQLLPPRDYKGVIEYVVVSSRIPSERKLRFGRMRKEEFPWLKLMDRSGLEKFIRTCTGQGRFIIREMIVLKESKSSAFLPPINNEREVYH